MLLSSQLSILPIMPVIICAKAHGEISARNILLILQMMNRNKIDIDSKILSYFLYRAPKPKDIALLYLLKERIKTNQSSLDLRDLFNWLHKIKIERSEHQSLHRAIRLAMINLFSGCKCNPNKRQQRIMMLLDNWENASNDKPYVFGRLADALPINLLINERLFDFNSSVVINRQYFFKLLAGSISLNEKEKWSIISSLKELDQKNADALIEIFQEERNKFNETNMASKNELQSLEIKFLLQWLNMISIQTWVYK